MNNEGKPPEDIKGMDLYEILTKPVLEMDDEELMQALGTIREQRKMRIASSKAKTGLEILLGKLTPANARVILQQLQGQGQGQGQEPKPDQPPQQEAAKEAK